MREDKKMSQKSKQFEKVSLDKLLAMTNYKQKKGNSGITLTMSAIDWQPTSNELHQSPVRQLSFMQKTRSVNVDEWQPYDGQW